MEFHRISPELLVVDGLRSEASQDHPQRREAQRARSPSRKYSLISISHEDSTFCRSKYPTFNSQMHLVSASVFFLKFALNSAFVIDSPSCKRTKMFDRQTIGFPHLFVSLPQGQSPFFSSRIGSPR